MKTQVVVEEARLDEGTIMIFKEYRKRIRLAYDPDRITEARALELLIPFAPHIAGATEVLHRADI